MHHMNRLEVTNKKLTNNWINKK